MTTRKFPTLMERWYIATGGRALIFSTGNRTYVVDTATGKDLVPPHRFATHLVSPDGTTLFVRSRESGQAGETGQLWDLRNGKQVGAAFHTDASRACFSSDSRTLLLAEGLVVHRRDAGTGAEIPPPKRPGGQDQKPERVAPLTHSSPITFLVPSPEGEQSRQVAGTA